MVDFLGDGARGQVDDPQVGAQVHQRLGDRREGSGTA
jgi:hypothetical protein